MSVVWFVSLLVHRGLLCNDHTGRHAVAGGVLEGQESVEHAACGRGASSPPFDCDAQPHIIYSARLAGGCLIDVLAASNNTSSPTLLTLPSDLCDDMCVMRVCPAHAAICRFTLWSPGPGLFEYAHVTISHVGSRRCQSAVVPEPVSTSVHCRCPC